MYYSVKKAIDILADPEFVEMNLVSIPGVTNETLTQHLINVCEDRGGDALAVIDPKEVMIQPLNALAPSRTGFQ